MSRRIPSNDPFDPLMWIMGGAMVAIMLPAIPLIAASRCWEIYSAKRDDRKRHEELEAEAIESRRLELLKEHRLQWLRDQEAHRQRNRP